MPDEKRFDTSGRKAVGNGGNPARTRAQNLTVVLDALRKLQPISRTDLAKAIHLTPATMTHLVAELGELGFLTESRSPDQQIGRRPTLLSLERSVAHFIGVEISRDYVLGITTSFSGEVEQSVKRLAPATDGAEATLEVIFDVVATLWNEESPPVGIGVGVPGPVDTRTGKVQEPPNFPGWRGVALADLLGKRWGVPVLIDDDARTSALGEYWFGAGKQVENLLFLSIGSGVGAGLIVRGELYRGAHELAGEIGHITLDLNGRHCECGNRGCLETFVSTAAIRRDAAALGIDVEENLLFQLEKLASEGHEQALEVKNSVYRYLGAGIINAVNFYDPSLIVIGGELVTAWSNVTEQLVGRVRGCSFGIASKSVAILPSVLGGYASAIGAASLVIQHLFHNPYLIKKSEY